MRPIREAFSILYRIELTVTTANSSGTFFLSSLSVSSIGSNSL